MLLTAIERFHKLIGNEGKRVVAYTRDQFAGLPPPSIASQRPISKAQPCHILRNILRWNGASGKVVGLFILTAWLLAACAGPLTAPTPLSTDAPPPPLPAAISGEPAEALAALIQAERAASIDRDLIALEQLWAPDGRIVDGRNSAEPDDDYVWAGRDAIMDRYVVAVFPNPPPPLDTADALQSLTVERSGENMAAGINGGDRWQLIYADDRWWLQELVYQQP